MIRLHLDSNNYYHWGDEPEVWEIRAPWYWGFQWRPQFGRFMLYYDGWHYVVHLGFFYYGKSEGMQ